MAKYARRFLQSIKKGLIYNKEFLSQFVAFLDNKYVQKYSSIFMFDRYKLTSVSSLLVSNCWLFLFNCPWNVCSSRAGSNIKNVFNAGSNKKNVFNADSNIKNVFNARSNTKNASLQEPLLWSNSNICDWKFNSTSISKKKEFPTKHLYVGN